MLLCTISTRQIGVLNVLPHVSDYLQQDKEDTKKSKESEEEVPERLKYFLDHKKIQYLKQQFTYYDADGSGAISIDGELLHLSGFSHAMCE